MKRHATLLSSAALAVLTVGVAGAALHFRDIQLTAGAHEEVLQECRQRALRQARADIRRWHIVIESPSPPGAITYELHLRDVYRERYDIEYRILKATPSGGFGPTECQFISREAYRQTTEAAVRARFGSDIFGRARAEALARESTSSSGPVGRPTGTAIAPR